MAKRSTKRRTEPAQPIPNPLPANDPPPVNTSFRADQREAFEIKLLAQDLRITPAQLRSLRLSYGKDWPKIRQAAARLRRE
jgi:hypothetical protein